MSVLDSSQYLLTETTGPGWEGCEPTMNQNLSNKGLWCGDAASCKAATPFEVGL